MEDRWPKDEETAEDGALFCGASPGELRLLAKGLEPWARRGNWIEALCMQLEDMASEAEEELQEDDSLMDFIRGDWDEW